MVFFKKCEIRDLKSKYGGTQRGIFALEPIKKGEKIWYCECGAKDGAFTRSQLLDIIAKYPRLDYFVRSFSYMIDDDLYAMPYGYMEEKNNDECALFNHSCNPNCGFADDAYGDNVIACRDIQPGDELTYHYGFLETESSLIYGLKCKCNAKECNGRMTFDYYRDPEFVDKYYEYMTPYLKKKANDMKERWYSRSCWVVRFPNEYNDDLEEWEKGLVTIKPIKKGELIASFSGEDQITVGKHFIRNSIEPNCQLIGRDVIANVDIPADKEITLYYHGILL
jgi:hypothetical protein